jgi:hypothetical protein
MDEYMIYNWGKNDMEAETIHNRSLFQWTFAPFEGATESLLINDSSITGPAHHGTLFREVDPFLEFPYFPRNILENFPNKNGNEVSLLHLGDRDNDEKEMEISVPSISTLFSGIPHSLVPVIAGSLFLQLRKKKTGEENIVKLNENNNNIVTDISNLELNPKIDERKIDWVEKNLQSYSNMEMRTFELGKKVIEAALEGKILFFLIVTIFEFCR